MLKRQYFFPAIFEFDENPGYSVSFPDFPSCFLGGDSWEQTLKNAKEGLADYLFEMAKNGFDIPVPSEPSQLEYNSTCEQIVILEIDMSVYCETL